MSFAKDFIINGGLHVSSRNKSDDSDSSSGKTKANELNGKSFCHLRTGCTRNIPNNSGKLTNRSEKARFFALKLTPLAVFNLVNRNFEPKNVFNVLCTMSIDCRRVAQADGNEYNYQNCEMWQIYARLNIMANHLKRTPPRNCHQIVGP